MSDGQATTSPATVTVTVNQANDAPTLTLPVKTPAPAFTEGGSAAELFSNAVASTVESGQTFEATKLTVAGVRDATEQLVVDGVAVALTNGATGTTAAPNSITYSVSVTGTTATVTLTHAGADAAKLKTLLEGLAYSNSSSNPTAGNRTVTVTELKDSGGTTGSDNQPNGGKDTAFLNLSSQVSVAGSNSAPTLGGDGAFTVLEGGSYALTTSDVLAADADTALSGVTYKLSGAPTVSYTHLDVYKIQG